MRNVKSTHGSFGEFYNSEGMSLQYIIYLVLYFEYVKLRKIHC